MTFSGTGVIPLAPNRVEIVTTESECLFLNMNTYCHAEQEQAFTPKQHLPSASLYKNTILEGCSIALM